MTNWTDTSLSQLPVKNGLRLRGVQMSRLETFTDAAFAFAVTLLIISVDDVPESMAEFEDALLGVPAFLLCFAQLMVFWWGHHTWSRRYGLEEGWDMLLSLALVATVLVYVFPLRVIFEAFFWNFSGGAMAPSFPLTLTDIGFMFVIFGLGFTILAGLIATLFLRAYLLRARLALNALEVFATRTDALSWAIVAGVGAVSTALALTLPESLKPAASYVYWLLFIVLPLLGWWESRGRAKLG